MWCAENLANVGEMISFLALVAVGVAVVLLLFVDHRWTFKGTAPDGVLNLGLVGFGGMVAALLSRSTTHSDQEPKAFFIACCLVLLPSILLFFAAFASLRTLIYGGLRLRLSALPRLEVPLNYSAIESQNVRIERWWTWGNGVWVGALLVALSSLAVAGVYGRCTEAPQMVSRPSTVVPTPSGDDGLVSLVEEGVETPGALAGAATGDVIVPATDQPAGDQLVGQPSDEVPTSSDPGGEPR